MEHDKKIAEKKLEELLEQGEALIEVSAKRAYTM